MVYVVGGQWDERRNTSHVFPVEPGAASAAARALSTWAAANPAHAKWILDGYPTLTEAEHFARFGEQYHRQRSAAT